MPFVSKLQLPFEQWPKQDRRRWDYAFQKRDIFDDDRGGADLSPATQKALRASYAQYLRFLSQNHPRLLHKKPEVRIDRKLIEEYVGLLRKTNRDVSVATSLHHLRLALRLICPNADWSWLLTITKRIAAAAPRKPKKHALVSSEQLYLLGMELMDQAGSETIDRGEASKEVAFKYRDGVLIAVLSLIVLRRRTVAALRIGKQLVKSGGGWALDIPSEDVKSKRPLDFALAPNLCDRIDL